MDFPPLFPKKRKETMTDMCDQHATASNLREQIWRGFLFLVGCVAAAYVGDELLGGEALGWIAGGAILGATGAPMFKVLLARNAARAASRQ